MTTCDVDGDALRNTVQSLDAGIRARCARRSGSTPSWPNYGMRAW